MSGKILCPTDGSAQSMVGVARAAELARQGQAALTLCVVNIAHGGARGPTINHWTDADLVRILDEAEATAKAAGLSDIDRVELISREAGSAIIHYAEEHGYKHIVMGTGDKRGVKRLVLGSVAAEVAGQSHCTVTIAR